MTINDLKKLDEAVNSRLEWNKDNIDKVQMDINKLKIKILGEFSKHIDELKKLEVDKNNIYGSRFRYYNESYDRKFATRKDIEDMINQDQIYIDICKKYVELETITDHLEKLLKIISETSWDMKNWVEIKKLWSNYGKID
jgi:hypothetical protein